MKGCLSKVFNKVEQSALSLGFNYWHCVVGKKVIRLILSKHDDKHLKHNNEANTKNEIYPEESISHKKIL